MHSQGFAISCIYTGYCKYYYKNIMHTQGFVTSCTYKFMRRFFVYVHKTSIAYTKNPFSWRLISMVVRAREGGILRSWTFAFISNHPTEMDFCVRTPRIHCVHKNPFPWRPISMVFRAREGGILRSWTRKWVPKTPRFPNVL